MPDGWECSEKVIDDLVAKLLETRTVVGNYGENDSFYSLAYSGSNFDAYAMAGGLGQFREFTRASGLNGHFLVNDPALWGEVVADYLDLLP